MLTLLLDTEKYSAFSKHGFRKTVMEFQFAVSACRVKHSPLNQKWKFTGNAAWKWSTCLLKHTCLKQGFENKSLGCTSKIISLLARYEDVLAETVQEEISRRSNKTMLKITSKRDANGIGMFYFRLAVQTSLKNQLKAPKCASRWKYANVAIFAC